MELLWDILTIVWQIWCLGLNLVVFFWFITNYNFGPPLILTVDCRMPKCDWAITKKDRSKNGSERLVARMKAEHQIHYNQVHYAPLKEPVE